MTGKTDPKGLAVCEEVNGDEMQGHEPKDMDTELDLLSDRARASGAERIENVAHLLSPANLKECLGRLKRRRATGTDGVTLEEYEEVADTVLPELVERMKRMSYKPQPVKRIYIPKANGKMRPLGIPSVEDKVVQCGMTRILESVYEADFLDCSYGFRRGRGCHQALQKVNEAIMRHPVNHVIEADIKGFFDNVSHDWMLKFIGHRIADRKFQQLVEKFLKAGYMEEGTLYATEGGTPQGGVISPVLANIYLHYVLDLWIERKVKEESRGYVEMVRYADDFVICVQYKDDAERILTEVRERLAKFGLELAEEKTRRIEFGRYARQNAEAKGRKPESFDFLGFTYYIGKTRGGAFKVGMKTSRKKLNAKLKEMTQWIKTVRNLLPLKDLWKTLKAKLSGHFQYFGVSGNYREIRTYHNRVLAIILKWLNKRSQKKSFSWKTYGKYLEKYPLPKPKIHHDFYGLKCLFVNVTEEPYVGNLQVRFCEGR